MNATSVITNDAEISKTLSSEKQVDVTLVDLSADHSSEIDFLSADIVFLNIQKIDDFDLNKYVFSSSAIIFLITQKENRTTYHDALIHVISLKHLSKEDVIAIVRSFPVQAELVRQILSIQKELEVSKQVADLNINSLHRTLQELEKERKRVLDANKTKQLFLANITHELRTPLNVILGFTNLFPKENLNDEQSSSIKIIEEASKTLLSLVNDVLNFTKLHGSKLKISRETFDLIECVDSVVLLLQQKAFDKETSLSFINKTESSVIVKSDQLRIKQVLINLVSNAIKFTEKGKVTIELERNTDDLYTFKVSDTGIGIPPENLKTIFDSFNQGDANIEQNYEGTGLGLSIVQKIIELLNGEIRVESELGKGSTFMFQVRLEKGLEIEQPKTTHSSRINLKEKSVLVVEDTYLNQLLIQKILSDEVGQLVISGDGENAIHLCKNQQFDVILMDLNLPKISGIDAIRSIKKEGLNQETPIAVVSANIWEEQLNIIKAEGIETILTKPFRKEELLEKIQEMTSQKVISLDHIKSLADGDTKFIKEILQTLHGDIDKGIQTFKTLLEEEQLDAERARKLAHKMSNSFKMLSVDRAFEICSGIDSKKLVLNSELFKELESLCESIYSEIQNTLESLS